MRASSILFAGEMLGQTKLRNHGMVRAEHLRLEEEHTHRPELADTEKTRSTTPAYHPGWRELQVLLSTPVRAQVACSES